MEYATQERGLRMGFRPLLPIVAGLLFWGLFCPVRLFARPVNEGQARKAVLTWLKADPKPLGAALGGQVRKVDVFTGDSGEPAYYVVYLKPGGFVIVAADDLVEPMIGFVTGPAVYDPSDENPLGALVGGDVPSRVAAARKLEMSRSAGGFRQGAAAGQEAKWQRAREKAQGKWKKLLSEDGLVGAMGLSSISDVRVAPLVQSTWGQMDVCGMTCYNYYTLNNWPCGCVATSMAQLMRYHEHPGSYVWSNMPLTPGCGITTTQRQAIGDLCYDAAESVETKYGPTGSEAFIYKSKDALQNTFGYTNAIDGWYNNFNLDIGSNGMANPNLDAGSPLLLGIRGPIYGHAVVCDGYGYNASTSYHHLNMGWYGLDDAWYNLPNIDCDPPPENYNTVEECIYNIFLSGTGEVISGRVTDTNGVPLSGVTVTATPGDHSDTTDENGIYGLAAVPSNTSFTVSAGKMCWDFSPDQMVTTGQSNDNEPTSGNKWGIDFTGVPVPCPTDIDLDKDAYVVGEDVGINVFDAHLKGNGTQGAVIKICNGDYETVTLSEDPPGGGMFTGTVPTALGSFTVEDGTLQVSGSTVLIGIYEDANDGTGKTATLRDTAAIGTGSVVIYQTDFTGGLPAGWSIVDGYSDGKTWTSTNPLARSSPEWTGTFMIVDSFYWWDADMDEQLVTHSIDCSVYQAVKLRFKHEFEWWEDEICDVDVRVGGGSWNNVARYQGTSAYGQVEIDISSIAAGQADVQVRWHYYDAYFAYYWGIDDVQLTGVSPPEVTLGDFEPDCDVDFYDYAVLALAWKSSEGGGNWNPDCDISDPPDKTIDWRDVKTFAANWLETEGP